MTSRTSPVALRRARSTKTVRCRRARVPKKGQRATYDLVWNDKARTLTIGARRGTFPGMVQRRRLDLVLAGPGKANGIAAAPAARHVTYDGKAVTVRF